MAVPPWVHETLCLSIKCRFLPPSMMPMESGLRGLVMPRDTSSAKKAPLCRTRVVSVGRRPPRPAVFAPSCCCARRVPSFKT